MPKTPDTCAHCKAPIGPAHLWVSAGSVGPTGFFCLRAEDCYKLAWEAYRRPVAGAPAGAEAPGAGMGPGEALAPPAPNLGPLAA